MVRRRHQDFITLDAFDAKRADDALKAAKKAEDEANEIASRDLEFVKFMSIHSYSDIHKAFEYINWFFVDIRVMATGQHPIDSRTQTSVECVKIDYLYFLISHDFLTSNGEIIPRSFCKPVLDGKVLQWSSIGKSIVDYYKSKDITHNMLSNTPDDFVKPMLQLVFGIADNTTVIDASHIHTMINYNTMLNFNDSCCVQWIKYPEYYWYVNPRKMIIKPNIPIGIDDFYYCDSVDQFIVID